MVGDVEPPDLVADGTSVAWLGRASRPGESWVTGLGDDPDAVAALVRQLATKHGVDGITVPDDVVGRLPESLRSPDTGHW
jgi:hypothetical protein